MHIICILYICVKNILFQYCEDHSKTSIWYASTVRAGNECLSVLHRTSSVEKSNCTSGRLHGGDAFITLRNPHGYIRCPRAAAARSNVEINTCSTDVARIRTATGSRRRRAVAVPVVGRWSRTAGGPAVSYRHGDRPRRRKRPPWRPSPVGLSIEKRFATYGAPCWPPLCVRVRNGRPVSMRRITFAADVPRLPTVRVTTRASGRMIKIDSEATEVVTAQPKLRCRSPRAAWHDGVYKTRFWTSVRQ